MTFKKGDKIQDPHGKQVFQVTEVTPIGDAWVVLQLYIEGSRKQADITNPNPVLDTRTSQMVPPSKDTKELGEQGKKLNE